MQSFKQLSDVELAAVLTYVRNAWDNKAGDAVKPVDVRSAREKKSASLESKSTMTVAQSATGVVVR